MVLKEQGKGLAVFQDVGSPLIERAACSSL
jgi:hypothetical protein